MTKDSRHNFLQLFYITISVVCKNVKKLFLLSFEFSFISLLLSDTEKFKVEEQIQFFFLKKTLLLLEYSLSYQFYISFIYFYELFVISGLTQEFLSLSNIQVYTLLIQTLHPLYVYQIFLNYGFIRLHTTYTTLLFIFFEIFFSYCFLIFTFYNSFLFIILYSVKSNNIFSILHPLKMFKKGDFKRLQVLGSGKKNTKIYKAIHLATGQVYALKQVEAKNLDKLNQYKQEAVQLMKVQNHPNIIRSFGYYLSQTKYNSFKLGIVTQFIEGKSNLQYLYRKKKKNNEYWTQNQLVTMYCSLISTCSFLQSRGICHRDIKPANVFVLQNYEFKLIDFGQSKDYFYDPNDQDRQTFTMATIRGTPQYLSPILWKAHVIDGNSRFAEHNIYKSDVFSAGLVLIQLALMNEVTGFNSKTLQVNGQKLIRQHLKILQKMYSANFAQLFALLLRFEQSQRPSFCQIQALFYQKQLSCKQKNKPLNEYIKFYNDNFNNFCKDERQKTDSLNQTNTLKSTFPINMSHTQPVNENFITQKEPERTSSNNIQVKPKQNYYKDSTLMLHESCYWFQFGGSSIGRFSINRLKWKIDTGTQKKFPLHFSVVFIPTNNCYYLLGGPLKQNFLVFQQGKKIYANKYQMPTFRNFFSTVYHSQKVYVFGGYDGQNRMQIKTSECYNIVESKWIPICDLKVPRSQSSACRINDDQILICGGYNRQTGTLDSIQRYSISRDKTQILSLKLPIPLRRFMIVRVSKNKALVLGGLTISTKESQRVFRLDYEKFVFQQLQNLQKGGVIQNQILVDSDGSLHIFLQHGNGTSPHAHIKYPYDPTKQQIYETKQF